MARARKFSAWIVAATAALGACATMENREVAETSDTAAPAPITKDEVADASRPPPQNECQAASYQYLVGKKRSEVPQKPAEAVWRIACTACPVTMDYSPVRMNIFFDEKTEEIKEVRCG